MSGPDACSLVGVSSLRASRPSDVSVDSVEGEQGRPDCDVEICNRVSTIVDVEGTVQGGHWEVSQLASGPSAQSYPGFDSNRL